MTPAQQLKQAMACIKKGEYEKALQYLSQARESGFAEANRYYAYLLDMDPEFRRIEEREQNKQMFKSRSQSETTASTEATANKLKEAAEGGDAEAQFKFGECCQNGRGVKQNDAEAAKWYGKAAEQEHAAAQFKLAECYQNGKGVNLDDAEAVKWYRKAAKQGQTDAEYRLGDCYFDGKGVARNCSQAVNWYRKAAEQGHAVAQFKLAECLFNGCGVPQDETDAVKWYYLSAEQGHAEAQLKLAECFLNGRGVTREEAGAVKWCHKAAEQGNTEAQFILAECLFTGCGVNENKQDAVKWYRKAAEQGHPKAQFKLGNCYRSGIGIKEDKEEAAEWYRKASKQGIADTWAHFVLGQFCFDKKDFSEAVKWYNKAVAAQNNAKNCLSLSERIIIADHLLKIICSSSSKATDEASLDLLTRLSCWDSFSGDFWVNLLSVRPDYAKYCGLTADSTVTYWTKLTNDDWKNLANKNSLFKPYFDLSRGVFVAQHLSGHPEMMKFCDWKAVSKTGWINLLKKEDLMSSLLNQDPDLLRFCQWDKFSGKNWANLLPVCPEYVRHIKWDVLKEEDFEDLKTISAQLLASFGLDINSLPLSVIEKMNWGKYKDWSRTTAKKWLDILIHHPSFADFCKFWNDFTLDDWSKLLSNQPQFASRCHCWDSFEARHWNDLPSSLHENFPYDFQKMWNYSDYEGTIGKKLSKKFAFLVVSVCLFVFTLLSLWGEDGWFSLFAESKRQALISGSVWIIASVICATGYTTGWGPFFRNRWLHFIYAGFTSFSLYTFYHWSFLFSRWSWGMVALAFSSLLMFIFCAVDWSDETNDLHHVFIVILPFFSIFCWFMLSPVKCSAWLTATNAILFLTTIPAGIIACSEDDEAIYAFSYVVAAVSPLVIGIWFLLSPVDSDACYKMADSLQSSFKRASISLIVKGQLADPDFVQLENQLIHGNR